MIVSGEPGIGKTALLTDLLTSARALGCTTISGRAAEFERDLPFAAFTDALDDQIVSSRDVQAELDDQGIRELLAFILPSLSPFASKLRRADPGDRHRLLHALHHALRLLAGEHPLVLALDDLHWADAASIDLVCRLLHRGLADRSMFVLAFRPAQVEPRLQAAVDEVQRRRLAVRIDLGPLSTSDAAELLGDGLSHASCERLYRDSGGVPLYLEELAAAVRRHGALRPADLTPLGQEVPTTVTAALKDELNGLSPSAQRLAQTAALLGDPFDSHLAAASGELDDRRALAYFDELLARDLIRSTNVPGRFRFRHPIVRHAVYESTPLSWRLQAHGRTAALLESKGAPAMALAPHVARSAHAGDEKAVAHLVDAGQELMSRVPAHAAHWFEHALRLLPERDQYSDVRIGLLAQHAAALGLAGEVEQSRDKLREYLKIAPSEPTELRLRMAVLSVELDELLGSHSAGFKLLSEELAKLPNQHGPTAAELMREMAFTCFMAAKWPDTRYWARRTLASDCDEMTKVGALAVLGLASVALGRVDDARKAVSKAADAFDAVMEEDEATHRPNVSMCLVTAEVHTERFADAIRHAERSITVSHQAGQTYLTLPLLVVQGEALGWMGRVGQLSTVAEAAIESALLCASDVFLSLAMTIRCWANLLAGDLHAALRFGERAADVAIDATSPHSSAARLMLAMAMLELGEHDQCLGQLMGPANSLRIPPFPPSFATLACELLTHAYIARGDLVSAQECAMRAHATAESLSLSLPSVWAHRASAALLLVRGDARAAATEAMTSYEAAELVEAHVEGARSQVIVGQALAAAGDRRGAISRLQSAHRTLRFCAAERYCDYAARELRKLGRTVPRRRSVASNEALDVLGMTNRESEVMELVASGNTNREVAAKLFLSVRTVDRHVARIFEKLDVHSRAAATRLFERARARID